MQVVHIQYRARFLYFILFLFFPYVIKFYTKSTNNLLRLANNTGVDCNIAVHTRLLFSRTRSFRIHFPVTSRFFFLISLLQPREREREKERELARSSRVFCATRSLRPVPIPSSAKALFLFHSHCGKTRDSI